MTEAEKRKEAEHMVHIRERIQRLEANLIRLVKILDKEQLQQFIVSTIIDPNHIVK